MRSLTRLLVPTAFLLSSAVPFAAAQDTNAAAAPQVTPAPLPGALDEAQLGEMLTAIGLKPTKTEQRYDFAFKTAIQGEEWKFSMSAVLSRNGESVWVMAWLDQIPATASEVPRTALLRLLAANDRLGEGKFFAYIPTNKRFVMQRVLTNRDMTNKKLLGILQDLSTSVAEEYPTWSVANWAPKAEEQIAEGSDSGRAVPQNPAAASKSSGVANQTKPSTRASESASKFDGKSVN